MYKNLLTIYVQAAIRGKFTDDEVNAAKSFLCNWIQDDQGVSYDLLIKLHPVVLACCVHFINKPTGFSILNMYLNTVTPTWSDMLPKEPDWSDVKTFAAIMPVDCIPNNEGLWEFALLRKNEILYEAMPFTPAACVWLHAYNKTAQDKVLKRYFGKEKRDDY